jgi:hypothetical protein
LFSGTGVSLGFLHMQTRSGSQGLSPGRSVR